MACGRLWGHDGGRDGEFLTDRQGKGFSLTGKAYIFIKPVRTKNTHQDSGYGTACAP